MSEVPPGWVKTSLSEVAEVQLGRQRSPKDHSGDSMKPYLRAANVTWNGVSLDDVKEMNFTADETERYRLATGDLLLSEASGSPSEVGKPAIWSGEIEECCFQNTLIRVRPLASMSKFLLYLFKYEALSGGFARASRGVGIHHLGAASASSWPIRLPPLAEQARIVAAIEEHFSHLDAGVGLLERARLKLRRMRATVLQAAVDGHLLPQDPSDESAADRLRFIETERRLNWIGRYKELPHVEETRPLPAGWNWTTLGGVCLPARYGTSVKCAYEASGPPVLRIPNIRNGRVLLSDLKFATDAAAVGKELFLREGDLLFVRTNGSRDLIGTVGCVGEDIEAAFASYLIRFRPVPGGVLPAFLRVALSAPSLRRLIEARAATTAGQYNLSVPSLESLPVPLPPREEQERIVAEVDRQLSLIEAQVEAISDALRRKDSLIRALLNEAFSGRLVPQDPTDEPAAAVLERITATRDGSTPKRRTRRSTE